MRKLVHGLTLPIERSLACMPSGSRKIAVARSLIALAQLSVLLLTEWDALFVSSSDKDFGPSCDGVARIGAYCMMYSWGGLTVPTLVVIASLLLVLSGYFPRYTGLLHAWVTLSFAPAISFADGGESISQVLVLLLALVLLSDGRKNHWMPDEVGGSKLLPLSWVAAHLIRFQIAWLYLNSAIEKTAVPEWRDGSAVYFITLDPMFGTAPPFGPLFDFAVDIPFLSLMMTWGTIAVEMSIAFFLVGPRRSRRFGVWLSVCLHILIIAMIGLWSFAFIMIGAVIAASGPTVVLKELRPKMAGFRSQVSFLEEHEVSDDHGVARTH